MSLCVLSVCYYVASILSDGWTEVNRRFCVTCACSGDVLVWRIWDEDHSDENALTANKHINESLFLN